MTPSQIAIALMPVVISVYLFACHDYPWYISLLPVIGEVLVALVLIGLTLYAMITLEGWK